MSSCRCGFSTELCQEALQICEGDAGAALEYLLNELFNINLTVAKEDDVASGEGETEQEILEAREEEKLALQSIYDSDFEECIPNKVWLLNLKLPELHELLENRSHKRIEKKVEKKLCPFYLKGFCKFKDRCRLSHTVPVEAESQSAKNLSHPIYANLKAIERENTPYFSLEIRFPAGNKYPYEPPLVVFSSVMEELPAHTRLNISQSLMSLARDAAQDHLPCVFTLVSALEDKDRLELLLSLPSPSVGRPVSVAAGTTQREFAMGAKGSVSRPARQREALSIGNGSKHGSGKSHVTETDDYRLQNFVPQKRKDASVIRSSPFEIRRQNKILQDEFQKKQASFT